MRSVSKLFFLIAFIAPMLALAVEDIQVGSISTKKMSEVDSSGDIWFSIKTVAKNTSQVDKEVQLVLQAVDSEGFELNSITLTKNIKAGEEDTLTVKTFMANKQFREISKWILDKVRTR